MSAPERNWQPSAVERDRRAIRRRERVRSVVISALSTVALAVALWLTVINTPGWAQVQHKFFEPEIIWAALPRVWDGFLRNLIILLIAVPCVLIVSVLLAALRTLRGPIFFPLRVLAAGYTDLFRALPLIIVLYLVGYGIPALQGSNGIRIPAIVLGTIAIVLTYSAYVSEVFRAGIEAVHPSQRLAARALGLSHGKALRLVVLPQAVRKVTPALMNDFIAMQKDVGLVSVLGAVDAVRAAQIETAKFYNYTPYVLAGLLFVLLALPLIRLSDWYTERLRDREQTGGMV